MAYKYVWKFDTGICIINFPIEVNHIETLYREYSMIKSVGACMLNDITNGTAYGCMKLGNDYKIMNFGLVLVYYALKICIHDRPTVIKYQISHN